MIKHIQIHKFRLFNDIGFNLGKKITVIAGQNATGKSTLLGLLGATAELKQDQGTPLLKKQFRAEFREMFAISEQYDVRIARSFELTLCDKEDWNGVTEKFNCRCGWWDKGKKNQRYRIVPIRKIENKPKTSSAKLNWPCLYLGLSRLYPIGESENVTAQELIYKLTTEEKQSIAEQYAVILSQFEIPSSIHATDPKDVIGKKGIGVNTDTYDYLCNSAGQDNLGQIIIAMTSFKKQKEKMGEDWDGGLLLIDEFDSTLHPSSQRKLFDYLLEESSKLNVQVVFTTHSLYLLEYTTKRIKKNNPNKNNDIELVYLSNANGALEKVQNPKFNRIKYDLNMMTERDSDKKIKIYCEDYEAQWFARQLLQKGCDLVAFTDFRAGKNQIIDLYKSDDYFRKGVLLLLDGDATEDIDKLKDEYSKIDNIVLLPSSGKSPEQTLYEYAFQTPPSETLKGNLDPNKGQTIKHIWSNHNIAKYPADKPRKSYKNWFNDLKVNYITLLIAIVESWITDNQDEKNEFIESFIYSYNLLAVKKSIPVMKKI